jgi:hypothetical protein
MLELKFLDYFMESYISHYLQINEDTSDFMINGIYIIIHRNLDFSDLEKTALNIWFEKTKYSCEEFKIEENRITLKRLCLLN